LRAGGIMTGTLDGALKGAAYGAISGGISNGIGSYFSDWSIERVLAESGASGVMSEIMGGEFKDGFKVGLVTSSARYLYNETVKYGITWESGGDAISKYPDTYPAQNANNIGTANTNVDLNSWFGEGGKISKVLNQVPGLNATAGMHDVMQIGFDKITNASDGWLRTLGNIPAMAPAAAISYTALLSNQTTNLIYY
jgi:hypothetical protein